MRERLFMMAGLVWIATTCACTEAIDSSVDDAAAVDGGDRDAQRVGDAEVSVDAGSSDAARVDAAVVFVDAGGGGVDLGIHLGMSPDGAVADDGTSTGDAGGGGAHANEPAGFAVLADRNFDALDEDGMVNSAGAANWEIIDAATYTPATTPGGATITAPGVSPRGDANVGQIRFPMGFGAGAGPIGINFGTPFSSRGFTKLYVDMDFQTSSNWSGHATGVLKMLMPRHDISGVTNRIIVSPFGRDLTALHTALATQGTIVPATSTRYATGTPATAATITRGRWHRWECLFTNNTPGNTDGRVEVWQDGVKVIDMGGYQFVNTGSHRWANVTIDPTYGGTGGTVPDLQFVWIDNLYISGAP